MSWLRRFTVVWLFLAGFVGQAEARNIALVIGNDGYANVPRLRTAVNDAKAIGATLERLGFVVRLVENADRDGMSRALSAFGADVQPGDQALFYYAGHGFEIDGRNYLLPTDVPAARPGQERVLRDASFQLDGVIEDVRERGAKVAIVLLDACRDNPFAERGTRSSARTRGLARVDAAEGVFVLMSASPKQAALDSLSDNDRNPNSVFTRSLLAELGKPGATLVQVAKRTQIDVRRLAASVGYEQTPAYYDQVIGDIVLADGNAEQPQGGSNQNVASNVMTRIETVGQGDAGVGVSSGPAISMGPGVFIGGKEARIAVGEPPAGPRRKEAEGAVIDQGGTPGAGKTLALVKPGGVPGTETVDVGGRAPIADFSRSNSSWTMTVSLPEPATEISYRIGAEGAFKVTGLLNVLDQRTGRRMPNPSIQLSPRTPASVIQLRYRTADGASVGPFAIRFDPQTALFEDQRNILQQLWPSWVEFRDFNKRRMIYFTTLISYRCAIGEARYGLDGAQPLSRFEIPPCDPDNPHNVPEDINPWIYVPNATKSISLQITWRDGTVSDVNTIENP